MILRWVTALLSVVLLLGSVLCVVLCTLYRRSQTDTARENHRALREEWTSQDLEGTPYVMQKTTLVVKSLGAISTTPIQVQPPTSLYEPSHTHSQFDC